MMETTRKLDNVDKKIIKALLRNSRTSFAEIASQCGLSTLTIKNRYNRLKKEGIIKGSTVVMNLLAFGYNNFAIFLIKVPNNSKSFEKNIRRLFSNRQDVFCEPVELNERYNIVLSLGLESESEIKKVRELIRQQPYVINVEVNVVYYQKVIPENLSLQADD
jgi:Lrp/AsnC family transcriptional regulator for asnA, asnC and gidA